MPKGYSIRNQSGWKHREETKQKVSVTRINKGLAKGEKNPKWKGGVTSLKKLIREGTKGKKWRKEVYKRDNYRCQKCYKRGGDLEADHFPKKFADIFHENKITSLEEAEGCAGFWDVNNGRTLCKMCHLTTFSKKHKEKMLVFCLDLDGTLCTTVKGQLGLKLYEKAIPLWDRIKKVNQLYDEGHLIKIETARGRQTDVDWLEFTKNQLKEWGVKYHVLRVGEKMHADFYIDDHGINDKDFFNET